MQEEYVDIYCTRFCNQTNKHAYCKEEEICANRQEWIRQQSDSDILDPHKCQDSCETPGRNCSACTNKEYFRCDKSDQCLHPKLVCDGHPQCEHGEDEDLSKCYKEYVKKRIISDHATMKCESRMYKGKISEIMSQAQAKLIYSLGAIVFLSL